MGTITSCGTTIIGLINTIFGLVGLVILVAGCFVKLWSDKVDALVRPLLQTAAQELPPDVEVDIQNLNISEFVGDASTAFIVLGSILLVVVIWAYCGTCCHSRWMLIVYACVMGVVILCEVALAVIVTQHRNLIDDALKEPMKESLSKYYQGTSGTNAVTMGWNALMSLLNCCGVDGAPDFKTTALWDHTVAIPGSSNTHLTLEAPILCCANITAVPTCGTPETVYKEGCYSTIWRLIEEKQSMAIGVVAGFGALQVVLLVLTVCVVRDMSGKNKVSPM